MSEGINKVILFGNLGADAELKQTSVGPVLKFRLATKSQWLDKEKNKQEKTEWHHVTVFGSRGEALAKYLHKGDRLFVEGSMRYSSVEKDGQKRYFADVIADEIRFGGGERVNGGFAHTPSTAPAAEISAPF